MHRWALALWTCLALGAFAPAQAWDPDQRVHDLDGVIADDALRDALHEQLSRLSSSLRYHVAGVAADSDAALWKRGVSLGDDPAVNAERDVLLVWSPDLARAAVVIPTSWRDRLGWALWGGPDATAPVSQRDPAAALIELARAVERDLAEAMSSRDRDALQNAEEARDRLSRQAEELRDASRRLTRVELRCLELTQRGLNVDPERGKLEQARSELARALQVSSVFPARAFAAIEYAQALATELTGKLDELEQDLRESLELFDSAERSLEELEEALQKAEGEDVPKARRAHGEAHAALNRARSELESGHPTDARRDLDAAIDGARFVRDLLAQPATPVAEAPEDADALWLLLPWLGVGLGLLLGGSLLIRSSLSQHTVQEVDDLRGSLVEQASAFERELGSLRRLHLEASRPGPLALPAALAQANGLAMPRRYTGETAEHLAKSRARLETLHASWRTLRQAVVESDAVRAGVGWGSVRGVEQALQALQNVPVRNLPVATVRTAAQELDRLQQSGEACQRALGEAAEALARLEARFEEVLQAGQITQPFEDALTEVQELSHLAAFRAPDDPVGAARQAALACEQARQLEARLDRTLGMAQDLEQVHERLHALAVPPSAELAEEQLPSLVAWAFHLGDEVSQALDEGARDEALRDLERLNALTSDAEILSKGPVAGPAAELELLREELHQAHLALDELRAEFSPESWEDIEQSLMRAAGRVELLAEELQRGARIPRAYARLNEIRAATLQATTRLLEARSERERAGVLLADLQTMRRELLQFVADGIEQPSAPFQQRLDALSQRLDELAAEAGDEDAPPDWGAHRFELQGLAAALGVLRDWAGDQCLQLHRARVLKGSLQRRIRETEDFMRRQGGGIVGAEVRLHAARESSTKGDEALATCPRTARAHYELGLRATREAREVIGHRGAIHGLPAEGGLRGDAIQLIRQAHRAYGLVHRAYLLGLTPEPQPMRDLIAKAGETLEEDPERAMAYAARAFDLGDEGVLKSKERERAAEDQARAREHDERLRLAIDGYGRALAKRRAELARRTRFEILVLGADGDVDIDAEDEDESAELEALEVATSDEADLESAPEPEPDEEPAEPEAAEAKAESAPQAVEETAEPQPAAEPQPEAAEPQPEAAEPQPEAAEPEAAAEEPQPEPEAAADPEAAEPEPAEREAAAEEPQPEPEAAADPEASEPEPAAEEPQPEPDETAPESDTEPAKT